MTMENRGAKAAHLEDLAARMTEIDTRPIDGHLLGMQEKVAEALDHLKRAMFPYHFGKSRARFAETEKRTYELMRAYDALQHPAAKSLDEVVMTYPAFIAIFTYRIAHKLYELGVPMIPRVMTEQAHEVTGIDIHPGATIGRYFFIDHGTGVVIGETTTIGEHVKLYQHVTLGAKSFPVGPDGTPVKGIKRHPDLGDRVIVYAGATILGGDTKIGDDCVVGGNVWLTHSLDPGVSIVTKPSGQAMSTDNLDPEDSIEWFI